MVLKGYYCYDLKRLLMIRFVIILSSVLVAVEEVCFSTALFFIIIMEV